MTNSYSIEGQDQFAYSLFKNLTTGFFIDIGCAHPVASSNTCLFDLDLGWSGLAFDAELKLPWCGNFDWHIHRPKTIFTQIDVTLDSFVDTLKNLTDNNQTVEYVSIDVDGTRKNNGFKALANLVKADVRFKALTIEHECYIYGEKMVRLPSRKLLESLGYRMLFSNVSLVIDNQAPNKRFFEDWWIDPQYFKPNIINEYGGEELVWTECIERIKEYQP
jgi:hypothetical protein